jgi:hypothetical protein
VTHGEAGVVGLQHQVSRPAHRPRQVTAHPAQKHPVRPTAVAGVLNEPYSQLAPLSGVAAAVHARQST